MLSAEPERIGKYEILGRIAQGGMAEIYLARQPGIGGFSRRVVLKCILPLLAEEPRFVEMFMEEARLASQIHHPNVVQIFDVGEEDETFFIAMEYIDGLSVGSMCADDTGDLHPLPIPVAAEIVMQACAGLHAAHKLTGEDGAALNLVHRDVSPQNLMVNTDGVVKLVDFGIAKAQDSSVTTRTGNIKGKYAYMSPEQVKGGDLDRRSDIFSLGTVFHELLTGQRLFHRSAELAILVAIIEEDYPAAHEVNPEVPPELSAVILKALERDRSKRYSTAAELGAAVREIVGKLGYYTSSDTLAEYLSASCADQLASRKVRRLDLGAQESNPPFVASTRREIGQDQPLPEIIDLPPPRAHAGGAPASGDEAVSGGEAPGPDAGEGGASREGEPSPGGSEGVFDEPTVQAMQPIRSRERVVVERPPKGPLPEPDFADDDPLGIATAPTQMLAAVQTASGALHDEADLSATSAAAEGRLTEPTLDLGPRRDIARAIDAAESPPRAPDDAAGGGRAPEVDVLAAPLLDPEVGGGEGRAPADDESLEVEPIAPPAPLLEPEVEGGAPADAEPLEVEPTAPPPAPERDVDAGAGDGADASAGEAGRETRAVASRRTRSGAAIKVSLVILSVAAAAIAGWWLTRGGAPAGPPLTYAHPPSYGLETIRQGFGPLARYLSRRMRRPVEVTTTPDYETLEDRLVSGEIDFANLPPLLFVTAKHRDPNLAVLAVHAYEGSHTDQSYIIARDDAGIRTVAQLEGRRFCHPDPRSTTGYLMPRQFLREKGLNPDVVLSEVRFSKGHVGVMQDIIAGRCDAGAVNSSAWRNARELGIKAARIRLVAVAGDVTRDVVCASSKLPASLRESLRHALLEFRADRDLSAGAPNTVFPFDRFVKIRPDVFRPVEEAARVEKLIQ